MYKGRKKTTCRSLKMTDFQQLLETVSSVYFSFLSTYLNSNFILCLNRVFYDSYNEKDDRGRKTWKSTTAKLYKTDSKHVLAGVLRTAQIVLRWMKFSLLIKTNPKFESWWMAGSRKSPLIPRLMISAVAHTIGWKLSWPTSPTF